MRHYHSLCAFLSPWNEPQGRVGIAIAVFLLVAPLSHRACGQSIFAEAAGSGDSLTINAQGDIFAPSGSGISQITPAGTVSLWSSVPGYSLALTPAGDGYMATRNSSAGIIHIAANGVAETALAAGMPWTDVALSPSGNLYADVWLGSGQGLYSINTTTGSYTEVVSGGPGSNGAGYYFGMAFGSDGSLYALGNASNTGNSPGLFRLNGSTFSEVAALPVGQSGLTVDTSTGNFYTGGTFGTTGNVYEIPSSGGSTALIASGLSGQPSGVAFDSTREILYVLNQNAPYVITAYSFRPSSVAWTQPTSGNWSTASNWTPATVPTSSSSANFNTGSTTAYAVVLTAASAANNLTVQGDTVTLNLGSNQLALAGSLSVYGSASQPGSLTLSGTTGGNVSAPGGVSVGQPTDAKPASAAQYNSLGVLQAAALTGNVTLTPSGQLWGNGTVVGNVVNGGLVSPGTATAPGNLQITGNYSQQALGTLGLRVNGASTSGNFDSINVAGNASLSGGLGISLGGYTPSIGNTYNVLTAASLTGSFNNGSNLAPAGTGFFKVTYSGDAVMLQPTYVITFFADSSTYLGHAFVEMTSAVGLSGYYGFYSNGVMPWGASGHVQPDTTRPWQFSIEYPVSQSSYLAAAAIIQNVEATKPNYGLTSFNCTDFIESVATAASIQLPNVKDSHGISDPQAFASSLQAVGNGNTTYGGTVIFNTQSPQIVPAITGPVDYSYSGLEQAGHASAGTLASALGVPLDQVNLGTVLCNSTSGISINISNADPSEALISMNWGDGSAYQVQGLTFSHVYAPGTYTADLLDIDDGAVHSYDMTVLVSASASTPLDISVTAFPPNDNANPGLVPAGPVPGVPEPGTLTLAACGGLLLLLVHHRRKRVRRTGRREIKERARTGIVL